MIVKYLQETLSQFTLEYLNIVNDEESEVDPVVSFMEATVFFMDGTKFNIHFLTMGI